MNAESPNTLVGSVVLVHGIRTDADWYQDIRKVLQDEGYRVHLTNYGYFDLVRFLIPFEYFRNQAKNKVFRQIRDAQKSDAEAEFSIIAHSFGTYIVSRILQDEFDLKMNRIIFTGSVVQYDFPFEQFSERFQGDILNDVAVKDPWPVIAESVTAGYGSAGTFGFKRPRVYDRWNKGGHSTVLNAEHCTNIWVPFLRNGKIDPRVQSSKVPLWIRLIRLIHIKYVLVVTLLLCLLLFGAAYAFSARETRIQMYPGATGWQLTDNGGIAEMVNSQMDQVCPVSWLFGRKCDVWLARYITKRSWRGVHRYDHRLNDLLFPDEWIYSYRNPEAFWFDLSEAYPNCILIKEVRDDLEIALNNDCNLRMSK